MRSRGLGDPEAPETAPRRTRRHRMRRPRQPLPTLNQSLAPNIPVFTPGTLAACPSSFPMRPTARDDDGPHEYTWKTVLCDCDTNEQAQELSAALQQAGIESWVQQAREFGRRYARVLVAADQLDQARAIAAQPIPQEIVEESKRKSRVRVPKCPKCGAERPGSRRRGPRKHLALRAMRRAMDRIRPADARRKRQKRVEMPS